MSRGVAPEISHYLRIRVKEWLAEDRDRSLGDLAKVSGISKGHISFVLSTTEGVGLRTALGLGQVFGHKTFGEVEAAATRWAQEHGYRPASAPPRSRTEQPRLRDRPEWAEVVAAAREQRSWVPEDFFDHVGQMFDNDLVMPRPLTARWVAAVALAFADEARH
jgi:hypothetical protein